jgi:S-adenosylmethionine hydrolase
MGVISLLSDFGTLYPGQMKAVILGINQEAIFVDITHDIPPQNIKAGAFALMCSVPYFPEGTVHLAVVDPGVGTTRRGIVVKSGGHLFVGPDNGLLIPAAYKLSDNLEVREITNSGLFLNVSPTFHGRDIFAPLAAHLLKGMTLSEVGGEISDIVELDLGTPLIENENLEGAVIYVDDFGNIITNIPGELLLEIVDYGDLLNVAGKKIPLEHTYSNVGIGEGLAIIGSHGYLEIAVNSGNASKLFGCGSNNRININKVL